MAEWRSRLYDRTRDVAFLWKCCVGIVLVSLLGAGLMQALRTDEFQDEDGDEPEPGGNQRLSLVLYQRLASATQPQPEALASWIRGLTFVTGNDFLQLPPDAAEMNLRDTQVRFLVEKHLTDEPSRELFAVFAQCWLPGPGPKRQQAWRRLEEIAAQRPALRFASEFEGDLLLREAKTREALEAYVSESGFDEAARARALAFSSALTLGDKEVLRQLCADPRVMREMDAGLLLQAARLLEDRWMTMRAVVVLKWRLWTGNLVVPLAVFAAAVWYGILVHSGSRERGRWLRYLSAVVAGVLAVWLLHWLQNTLRYSLPGREKTSTGNEIFQYVMYVGVPEEGVKLCLFALFLPLLLRNGSDAKAALTAGCVGLGFALDENVQYYLSFGVGAAVSRLVTANFMHIALTGLAGVWLYRLFRSRFHVAAEFLAVGVGVVVAHGVYDFASTQAASEWGIDLGGTVILAVLARLYLRDLKSSDVSASRSVVTCAAVFCVGLSVVVGAALLMAVWQTGSMNAATDVLKKTLSIIPVAVLFVREFREA